MVNLEQFLRKTDNHEERLLQAHVFQLLQIMGMEHTQLSLSAERDDDEEALFWETMEHLDAHPAVLAELRKHYDGAIQQEEDIKSTPLQGPFYEQAGRFIRYGEAVLNMQAKDNPTNFIQGLQILFQTDGAYFGFFMPDHFDKIRNLWREEHQDDATVGPDFYLAKDSDLPEDLQTVVNARVNRVNEGQNKVAEARHAKYFVQAVTGFDQETVDKITKDAHAYVNQNYGRCDEIITTAIQRPEVDLRIANPPKEIERLKGWMPVVEQVLEDGKVSDSEYVMLNWIARNMIGGFTNQTSGYLRDARALYTLSKHPLGSEREVIEL